MKLFVLSVALLVSSQANAGVMFYSDQGAFETALNSPMTFEGFNDNPLALVEVESGYIRYRTNSSLVSEGERALTLRERNSVTFHFNHEVFAFGLFVNELNSTNLNYTDNLGNELIDALKVTDIWNASTFFGVTSDVALTSFTLTGFTTSSNANAVFGIDALQFTASPTSVPEPATWLSFLLALFLLVRLSKQQKT
ncbi:PEP-CTERM sorting domain-containing protein [Thalassotalea euphylliae]|uniref:PEP-CTERM sorting domain-containing protein n=1 Tax=Thalassotalea euphylliae TaxID=1655234 RepID=A0A3E0TSC3_9GAMM|nr:PEP-CTERM sorting domain-containing protein [Thalassotalea euphylliae]